MTVQWHTTHLPFSRFSKKVPITSLATLHKHSLRRVYPINVSLHKHQNTTRKLKPFIISICHQEEGKNQKACLSMAQLASSGRGEIRVFYFLRNAPYIFHRYIDTYSLYLLLSCRTQPFCEKRMLTLFKVKSETRWNQMGLQRLRTCFLGFLSEPKTLNLQERNHVSRLLFLRIYEIYLRSWRKENSAPMRASETQCAQVIWGVLAESYEASQIIKIRQSDYFSISTLFSRKLFSLLDTSYFIQMKRATRDSQLKRLRQL